MYGGQEEEWLECCVGWLFGAAQWSMQGQYGCSKAEQPQGYSNTPGQSCPHPSSEFGRFKGGVKPPLPAISRADSGVALPSLTLHLH